MEYLTKKAIILYLLPYMQVGMGILGGFLVLIELVIFAGNLGIFIVIGVLLVIGSITSTTVRTFDLIKNMQNLKKQEMELSFNFEEEMKRNEVKGLKFESPEWYINIQTFNNPSKRMLFIAMRKDYIKRISKKNRIKRASNPVPIPFILPYEGARSSIDVTLADKTMQTIFTYEPDEKKTLDVFTAWYKTKKKDSQLSKKKEKRKDRDRRGRKRKRKY